MNNDYDAMIDAAGQHFNVDPALIKTVFHNESGGNVNAPRGAAGEIGAFQFMPATAARMQVADPSDITQAIPGAARLLREGLDKGNNNPAAALAYYNSGRVSGFPASTAAYIQRAAKAYPGMQVARNDKKKDASTDYEKLGEEELGGGADNKKGTSTPSPKDSYEDLGNQELDSLSKPAAKQQAVAPAAPVSAPAPANTVQSQSVAAQGPAAPLNRTEVADPTGNPIAQYLRNKFKEEPGDYHFSLLGALLPMSHNDITGENRWDVPQAVKNLGTGVLDLIEGPKTGTVTTAGTMALANMLLGGRVNPSPASKAAASIPLAPKEMAARQGAKEALDNSITTPEFRANPMSPGLAQAPIGKGPAEKNPNLWDVKIPEKGMPKDVNDPVNQAFVDQILGAMRNMTGGQNSPLGNAMSGAMLGHMVGGPGLGLAMSMLAHPTIGKVLQNIPGELKKQIMKQIVMKLAGPRALGTTSTNGGYLNPAMQQAFPDEQGDQK